MIILGGGANWGKENIFEESALCGATTEKKATPNTTCTTFTFKSLSTNMTLELIPITYPVHKLKTILEKKM